MSAVWGTAESRGGVALRIQVDDEHSRAGWARAAAMLTVVVVLPTPPFWLATVMTRVASGRARAGREPGALPSQQHVLCRPGQRGRLIAIRVCQGWRYVTEVPWARESGRRGSLVGFT